MINANDPSFPRPYSDNAHRKDIGMGTADRKVFEQEGMTIRTQLAAMAMQGLLANPVGLKSAADVFEGDPAQVVAKIARLSVRAADALIAELNKI